jgi:hypothetical protein
MRVGPLALFIAFLVAISVVLAGVASTLALSRATVDDLNVDLAALIRADYSADQDGTRLAPLNERIFDAIRQDEAGLRRDASETEIVPVFHANLPEDGTSDDTSPGTATPTPAATPPSPTPAPAPTPTPTPIPTPFFSASYVSTADSFITEPQPDQNYGADLIMEVDQKERSFLMFDLSAIPPGATVNSATIILCLTADPSPPAEGRTHGLYRTTSAWTETGLTWNNQPTVAGSTTSTMTVPATTQCISADVAADVQAWLSGTANYGWRINDEDEVNSSPVRYAAREHPRISLQPTLDVTYTL